jgi:hypothetical protein
MLREGKGWRVEELQLQQNYSSTIASGCSLFNFYTMKSLKILMLLRRGKLPHKVNFYVPAVFT